MGALRLEQGNARGALESLAAARALAPADTAVYRDMAQAYYALGAPAEAAEVWRGAVAAVPGSGASEAFLNVAVLAREAGRHGWAEAERAYRAAMRLDDGVPLGAVSAGPAPLEPFLRAPRCLTLYACSALRPRPRFLNRAEPAHGAPRQGRRARYSYGNLLFDAGRLVEAARAYRAALRRDGAHEDAANNLGNALRQLGRSAAARAAFEAALDRHPRSAVLLLNAGQARPRARRPASYTCAQSPTPHAQSAGPRAPVAGPRARRRPLAPRVVNAAGFGRRCTRSRTSWGWRRRRRSGRGRPTRRGRRRSCCSGQWYVPPPLVLSGHAASLTPY